VGVANQLVVTDVTGRCPLIVALLVSLTESGDGALKNVPREFNSETAKVSQDKLKLVFKRLTLR